MAKSCGHSHHVGTCAACQKAQLEHAKELLQQACLAAADWRKR